MENGLNENLSDWHSTATQMQEVGRDGRRLIENRSGELTGKDARRVGERQGLRPRQRVRLTLVSSRGDQGIDSNLGDIPNVDESGSAGAGWHEETVIVNDIVSVGIAQILSKKAWSNNSPALWSKPKVLLDRVVRHEGVVPGTCDGNEYDLPHPLTSCDVEERIEGRSGVGDGWRTKQEDGIAALHSATEGARFEEIEWDHLDVVHRTSRVRLA